MIKAVIIDDEADARDSIKYLIKKNTPDIELLGEAESVALGIKLITEQSPDLIFLDIQMADGTGFDLLDKIEPINVDIIFTTAYDDYALKAFKYSATDYLLKPVDAEELEAALTKIRNRRSANINTHEALRVLMDNLKNPLKPRLALHDKRGINFIKPDDIITLTSNNNFTVITIQDKEQLVITKTLKEFEDMLDVSQFYRIHNTCIINLNHVLRYIKGDGGFVLMNDNKQYEVSRRKKNEFLEKLSLWSGNHPARF